MNLSTALVVRFSDVGKEDIAVVGGKGAKKDIEKRIAQLMVLLLPHGPTLISSKRIIFS
jgi:hypothetical protein